MFGVAPRADRITQHVATVVHDSVSTWFLPVPQHHRLAQDSVWVAILDSLYTRTGQPVVLVADSTSAPPRFGPRDSTGLEVFAPLVQELNPTLVADFRARNAHPTKVDAARLEALGLQIPVATVTRATVEAADVDPNTGLFRFGMYPGSNAVVRLSQVGFAPGKRQALAHVTFKCGPRCGGTQLVLLARERDQVWRVDRVEEGITF